jgi:hypothetical protein
MDRQAIGRKVLLASEAANQCVIVNKGVEAKRRFLDGGANSTVVHSARTTTSFMAAGRSLPFVAVKTFNAVKAGAASHGMSVN